MDRQQNPTPDLSPSAHPSPSAAPSVAVAEPGDERAFATQDAQAAAARSLPLAAEPSQEDLAPFTPDAQGLAPAPNPAQEALDRATLTPGQNLTEAVRANPNAHAAIQELLDAEVFKTATMKAAVAQGLQTGDFSHMKDAQASKLFELIKDELTVTAPANPVTAAPAPEASAPEARAPKLTPGEKFEKLVVDAKIDSRVAEALRGSATVESATSKFSKMPFEQAPVALKTAVLYAQNAAMKADDFTPGFVQGKVQEAMAQPNNKTLLALADTQGITIYAQKPGAGQGKDGGNKLAADAALPEGGVYDRAIRVWVEKGAPFAPEHIQAKLAAGQPLSAGDARELKDLGALDLEAAKVSREPATPKAVTPEVRATPEQSQKVLDLLAANPEGPGLPKPQYLGLSFAARHEVRGLVEGLQQGAVGLAVSTKLYNEIFGERQAAPASPQS